MTKIKVKLSNKKKVYIYIPRISVRCWHELIAHVHNTVSPNQKANTIDLWDDQSMIPEEMRERMYWSVSKTQFKNLPEDNFIITQNVGDTYYNSMTHYQIMIFMDEEYLPVINKAIEKAREKYEKLKEKLLMTNFEVWECSVDSDIPDKNPIRHYYKDFGVQYPDIEWFL